jgi:ankyrin repeat protein
MIEDEKKLLAFAGSGNIEKVKELLEKGVNVNVKGEYDLTPLHRAMEWLPHLHGKDFLELTKVLVDAGADVNALDVDGTTPMYLAAIEGFYDVVVYLHTHGADLNVTLTNGFSAVHEIGNKMGGGLTDVKLTMVRDGKKITIDDPDEIRRIQGSHPDDEFMGYVNTVRYVLEHGYDVNQLSDGEHQTALHNAAGNGSEEVVRLMLETGKCRINHQDKFGLTALHFASRKGYVGIVKRLITAGADPNIQENYGFTPLHEAAENNNLHIVTYLCGHGADLSLGLTKDFDMYQKNDTALDIAKKRKRKRIITYLIKQMKKKAG